MSARLFLIPLMMLTSLLSSCDQRNPPLAVLSVQVQAGLASPTPEARKAAIKKQISAVCPTALTDDELEFAAQFVETNRSKGAVWLAGRLLKMHRETKKCRGL